jgi:subtilisin-like proprotein convertase family protein
MKLGKALIVVFGICLMLNAGWGSAQVTETSTPALAIPDSTCSGNVDGQGGITDTITFSQDGTIDDVNVSVDITHTWRSDIQISLNYNSVRSVLILDADTSGDNLFVTFDDDTAFQCGDSTSACGSSSSTNCTDDANRVSCKAYDGAADVLLDTNYGGMSSTLGAWTLEVCDDAGGDTGTLDAWSITLDGAGLPVELMSFDIR